MSKKTIAILIILLIAFALRLWGIAYDLPYIYHPDEPVPIRIAHHMLTTGDYNPHFFDWPSFVIHINFLIQAANYFTGKLTGLWHSPSEIPALIELSMGVTYAPLPIVVLLGRIVTVFFGVGTTLLTILAGEKLTHRREVGFLAGLMMAVSPTNVYLNRFITPDTYSTFFIAAVFYASVLILHEGKTRSYVMAGICLGLAASSKYNAGLIIIALLASHFLRNGWQGYKDNRLYLALSLGALFFMVATPYAIFDFPTFYADFLSTGQHYSTGHAGMEGNTLVWYLSYLWNTTGPICLLALLGTIYGVYTSLKDRIILITFPLFYFVLISRFVVRNDRTLLPLLPFLFLLAASNLVYLYGLVPRLQAKTLRAASITALYCFTAAILGFLIARTITGTLQLTATNSRETARIWIEDNLPAGTIIALESYSPFVDPTRFSVHGVGKMTEHDPEWYIENGFEYLVFSQGMYGRFYREPDRYNLEVSQYDIFFNRFTLTRKFTDGEYEVRIYKVK